MLFEDTLGGNPTAATAMAYTDPALTFEFVADPERDFDDIFSIADGLPRVLVLDSRDMSIVYKHVGPDKAGLIDTVNDLLAGP